MISKSSKFPLRTDFLAFRSHARRLVTPHFTVYYLLPTTHPSRLAVVVPAKVSKLATTRNWLKRLTYDTLWPIVKDKKLDCIVIYKPLPLLKSPATKELILSELNLLEFK